MDRDRDAAFQTAFNQNRAYFEMMREWHRDGARIEPEMREWIERHCRRGVRILEVGCGEGSLTRLFASRHPETSFSGVDVSEIGVAMAAEIELPNAEYRVADLKELPYADGSFDFAYAQSVLEHVVGWEEALQEIHRVLKPGGGLLIRVGNGAVRDRRLPSTLLAYLLGRNEVHVVRPSFELQAGDIEAHQTQFDAQAIPSDILLRELRRAGFAVEFFTTRTETWRDAPASWKKPGLTALSYLRFWPFNHLGPTIVVLGRRLESRRPRSPQGRAARRSRAKRGPPRRMEGERRRAPARVGPEGKRRVRVAFVNRGIGVYRGGGETFDLQIAGALSRLLGFPGPPDPWDRDRVRGVAGVWASGDAHRVIAERFRDDAVEIVPGVDASLFRPVDKLLALYEHALRRRRS